jgi:curved DNA-binding protein CbpA
LAGSAEDDVRNRDPKGHYAALNISPGASQQEIRLAYKFLKRAYQEGQKSLNLGKIQEAYETLSQPRQRKLYDPGPSSPLTRPDGKSRLNSVPLLLTLLIVFVGVVAFAFGPAIRAHFMTFDVGADLYWKRTEKPLGVVLEHDAEHQFPDGLRASAYRIQLSSGEETVWLPALDLNRHCRVGESRPTGTDDSVGGVDDG